MIDVALECIQRGWYVFPCKPQAKTPLTSDGWKSATLDENRVREWWSKTPDANVAIACEPSNLVVVDIDHGLHSETQAEAHIVEPTFAVRTGRRPEFGLQLYYAGQAKSGPWSKDGLSGDVKSRGGYVMAPGSVHPSGERYQVIQSHPPAHAPEWVAALTPEKTSAPVGMITSPRRPQLLRLMGIWRASGMSRDAILVALIQTNLDRVRPMLDEDDLEKLADDAGRWPLEDPEPEVIIGKKDANVPSDWREWFDTEDDILNSPPVDFVIHGVIPRNRYTGIVALSGARKTITAWNLVRAMLTGEAFLGNFEVANQPERVLFLAAESARSELRRRLEAFGLLGHLGKRLFIRSTENQTGLRTEDIPDELAAGALIIFDTFVRFFDGDNEQDAIEARKFSAQMQRLVNLGATVIVMFHAPKGARQTSDMTVETIRGSSEFGAAMACCWGLQMLGPRWEDNTRMTQVKKREFQCDPPSFEFACDENGICTFVDEVVINVGKSGRKADKDGRGNEARRFIEAHPKLTATAISARLAELGIERKESWVRTARRSSSSINRKP